MKLSFVISALEEFAPRALQESWDNSGLIVGLPEGDGECTGAMLCVDVTEEIIEEAVRQGCNLVVSHHPLIFKGLKALTGRSATERTVAAAVRSGVAVYSAHTSLDSTLGGVSYGMAARLGARVVGVISPSPLKFCRISVVCPRDKASDVRLLMLDGGCGAPFCGANYLSSPTAPIVDNSSRCMYSDIDEETLSPAQGAASDADPADFLSDMLSRSPKTQVDATVAAVDVATVTSAIKSMPGAEDFTVLVQPLDNSDTSLGLGVVAVFDTPRRMGELVEEVRKAFGCGAIRASLGFDPETPVRKMALCGGAGGEFIGAAASAGAQLFVTADVRYHDFSDHRTGMTILDIGHFESESCAKDIFYHVLKNKFANFAVYYSELEQNPVKYL